MNPNFTPEMITPKLLKACEEQVQKYFGERDFDFNDKCLICGGFDSHQNCEECPLAVGGTIAVRYVSCVCDSLYLGQKDRRNASKENLLARGNRLIKILKEHGIIIYDAEVKK